MMMRVLNNVEMHRQVTAVRPVGQQRNVVFDGYGNAIEADISPEMEAYVAANTLPDEIPDLADGLDNEIVPEDSAFKPL